VPRKTRQASRKLGVSYWRLIGMLRSDKFQPPKKDASGDFVWSTADLDRNRVALADGRRQRGGEHAA
jgi:hypothetical protein